MTKEERTDIELFREECIDALKRTPKDDPYYAHLERQIAWCDAQLATTTES